MASAAGLVLAAGGIALANEVIFVPLESKKPLNLTQNINWRIIPATAILAITLTGLEKISQPFGVGLAGLSLLAVLVIPIGNAPTPLENAGKIFGKV
jgi:hypothetical protein